LLHQGFNTARLLLTLQNAPAPGRAGLDELVALARRTAAARLFACESETPAPARPLAFADEQLALLADLNARHTRIYFAHCDTDPTGT